MPFVVWQLFHNFLQSNLELLMSWVIYTSIIAVMAALLAIWFDRSSRSILEYNNKLSIERISKKDGKASVLLLIAHPDDESMFFSPTLMTLTSKPDVFEVNILCLSTCNSDRRDTREKELIRAAHVLGLNEKNVRFGNFIDGENVLIRIFIKPSINIY